MHGYADEELDLVRSLEMERHFRECAACARAKERIRALRTAMSTSLPYFEPPTGLERRLRARLRAKSPQEVRIRRFSIPWKWAAAAAVLVLVTAGVWRVTLMSRHSDSTGILAAEAVSSHVRSLMAAHLTDVPSSDRHTVKPWFSGKLDFAPAVSDFSGQGFILAGGRLDYLDGRPVAALVYQRRQHVINLFTWPAPEAPDSEVQAAERQGYHALHWTQGHMNYWVVSDLNNRELAEFTHLVRNAE
jgi:anti-sigma factor RsiW